MDTPQPIPRPQPELEPVLQPVESPTRRLPSWRLWLPLVGQIALILAVPAQDAYTWVAGQPITLQTAPVDPYDLLRGHYQTLRYDISNLDALKSLPGGDWLTQMQGKSGSFYVVLQAPAQATTPPKPWQAVRVSADRPTHLNPNQVGLQGWFSGWNITYGLEAYYMPDSQRDRLNNEIRQTQAKKPQDFVVEAKVDGSGNSVLTKLWVGDQAYQF